MKKKTALILVLIFTLAAALFMTSCGSDSSEEPAQTPEETAAESEETAEAEEPAAEPEETAPKTFEDYANENKDTLSSFQNSDEGGVRVTAEGNDLVYTYDMSKAGDYTKEQITSEEVISALDESSDSNKSSFASVAKTLEEQTEISGIRVVIRYTWKDELLLEKVYTSQD